MRPIKLGCYLAEAGDDLTQSIYTIKSNSIYYVVLDKTWGGTSIALAPDKSHETIRKQLSDNNISAVAVCGESEHIKILCDIATYYSAESVIINATGEVDWIDDFITYCIKYNLIPCIQPSGYTPTELLEILNISNKLRMIYDPVMLCAGKKIDPFSRYWVLFKSKCYAADIRDMDIGKGFKPPGFGNTNVDKVVYDILDNHPKKWMFIEPNLGARYSGARSKAVTFGFAMTAFDLLINKHKDGGMENDKPK